MGAGRTRWRRIAVGGVVSVAVAAATGMAAGASGGLTIDPPSAVPGATYHVNVDCGPTPSIYARNLQDAYVQGTIAPRTPDELSEVAPSTWQYEATAGRTDEAYYATCDGADAGTGRFDAEAPHLWFGPRPAMIGSQAPLTTLEGTDCPTGEVAHATITTDGTTTSADATIDEFGDWSVPLPKAVGTADIAASARCGSIEYVAIAAKPASTPTIAPTTPTIPTTPPSGPTAPPAAAPAQARSGTASFTG